MTTTPASTPLNAPATPVTDLRVGRRVHIPGHNLTGRVTSLDNDHKSTSIEIDHDRIISVPNTTRVHLIGLTCAVETYNIAHYRIPLRLSFTPTAIREHFEGDEEFPEVEDMADGDLAEVGYDALVDDRLYETFHEVLVDALRAHHEKSTTQDDPHACVGCGNESDLTDATGEPRCERCIDDGPTAPKPSAAPVIVPHARTEPLRTIRVIDGDDPDDYGPYDFLLTEWVSDLTALADQVAQVLRQVKDSYPDTYCFEDFTAALAAANLPVASLDLNPVVVTETF